MKSLACQRNYKSLFINPRRWSMCFDVESSLKQEHPRYCLHSYWTSSNISSMSRYLSSIKSKHSIGMCASSLWLHPYHEWFICSPFDAFQWRLGHLYRICTIVPLFGADICIIIYLWTLYSVCYEKSANVKAIINIFSHSYFNTCILHNRTFKSIDSTGFFHIHIHVHNGILFFGNVN